MRPQSWQPTRLPRPWDSPGKNTGVGCHFLLQCMKVKSESEVAQLWLGRPEIKSSMHHIPGLWMQHLILWACFLTHKMGIIQHRPPGGVVSIKQNNPGTKKPLDESERGEWKSWLKPQHSENEDHGIRSHHFKANKWGKSERIYIYIFFGSKITANGDCSHEIQRCLLLWRKAMTILDSILRSRDIILPTKVRLVKAMVFPVVMYGCESWTIKKAEHRRIDAFELWCWESLGLQGDPTTPS